MLKGIGIIQPHHFCDYYKALILFKKPRENYIKFFKLIEKPA